MELKIKKLDKKATLPTRNHDTDAGIDIYSTETKTLAPGEHHLFATGIAAAFADGYVALLWDRSGLGSRGVHRLAGVIDSSYRGEWKVALINLSQEEVTIKAGDKIVQCLLQKFEPATIVEVAELGTSDRGKKGFGSSGR